jgi:hypothetical protein
VADDGREGWFVVGSGGDLVGVPCGVRLGSSFVVGEWTAWDRCCGVWRKLMGEVMGFWGMSDLNRSCERASLRG